jgi:hypothetical protein
VFEISAEERAERGARWLDRHYPTWVTKVDPDRLDIGSSIDCIWGQLVGNYYDRPWLRLFRREVRLGFCADRDLGRRWDAAELTKAWRNEIAARRQLVDTHL